VLGEEQQKYRWTGGEEATFLLQVWGEEKVSKIAQKEEMIRSIPDLSTQIRKVTD
jgi:hypothetical protein